MAKLTRHTLSMRMVLVGFKMSHETYIDARMAWVQACNNLKKIRNLSEFVGEPNISTSNYLENDRCYKDAIVRENQAKRTLELVTGAILRAFPTEFNAKQREQQADTAINNSEYRN